MSRLFKTPIVLPASGTPVDVQDTSGNSVARIGSSGRYTYFGADSTASETVFLVNRGGVGDATGTAAYISTLGDGANNAVAMRFHTADSQRLSLSTTAAFSVPVVIDVSSGTGLRITNTGSGDTLLIEDDTNPDSTPIIVTAVGQMVWGHTGHESEWYSPSNVGQHKFVGQSAYAYGPWSINYGGPGGLTLARSAGAAIGGRGVVADNDAIGVITFAADDGVSAGYAQAATIAALVDGAPGTNSIPGRLRFMTTPAGQTVGTERMRISSDGTVSIGYLGAGKAQLHVSATATEAIRLSRPVNNASQDSVGIGFQPRLDTATNPSALIYAQEYDVSEYRADLVFATRDTDSDGAPTEKMRIASTGSATFSGTAIMPAATTTLASLRIPHGTAPSAPTNGDVWTTTTAPYARINGTTKSLIEKAVPFTQAGTLATGTGKARFYVEEACVIKSVRASVNTAPTGAAILVDVNKNGTTIWSTQGNRPTIAISGFTSGSVTNMNTTALAAGDYLTVDIDQVGSTVAGADLTVTVWLEG